MKNSTIINPEKTIRIFLIAIGILLIGQVMFLFTTFVKGYRLRDLFSLFNFNGEGNIPTLYSVIAILFASFLLFFIAFIKKPEGKKVSRNWIVLGSIFLLLAYDEAAQIHERLNTIRGYFSEDTYSYLYWAWVIPYGLLALFVGIYFLNFLKNLPQKTMLLFLAAGAVYITGAIGFELFNSYYRDESDIRLHLVITIEELLEMMGIVLFIYAILDYIKNYIGEHITVSTSNISLITTEKLRKESSKEVMINE